MYEHIMDIKRLKNPNRQALPQVLVHGHFANNTTRVGSTEFRRSYGGSSIKRSIRSYVHHHKPVYNWIFLKPLSASQIPSYDPLQRVAQSSLSISYLPPYIIETPVSLLPHPQLNKRETHVVPSSVTSNLLNNLAKPIYSSAYPKLHTKQSVYHKV
jgi:hypothetical protein